MRNVLVLLCVSIYTTSVAALVELQQQQPRRRILVSPSDKKNGHHHHVVHSNPDRRGIFVQVQTQAVTLAALLVGTTTTSTLLPEPANAVVSNGIQLTTSPSGLRWADPKVGTGQALKSGSPVSIDYSMASTAGRFPQIYTTKDTGSPYRWTLGDGSTIAGIELAILGSDKEGIPPMQPGGIRRVIIPEAMGYQILGKPNAKCIDGAEPGSIGPIPPKDNLAGTGAYQRWYQFYCNPRIPYQPDLVVDIKLYGKR